MAFISSSFCFQISKSQKTPVKLLIMQQLQLTLRFRDCIVSYFILQLFLLLTLTQGKVVRYTFDIKYVSGNPDGVWGHSILAVNGRFPGPVIEADAGDTLQITVINNIQDGQNTTIHWHGIHQRRTPFEDGPSQITQCPIKHGSTQVYTFPVPLAGTYWYHSHVNSQYTEGLWGAMIIRDRNDIRRHMYDQEILITLNDWYHTSAHKNEQWYLRPETQGAPPYPFSALMNGVGRYPCNLARAQGRPCNTDSQKRPVYRIQPGRTYRLRLINTSAWAAFNFTIEGHSLTTIEVDGVETFGSNAIQAVFIGAGQRYSFLLTTLPANRVREGAQFLIRARLRREFLFRGRININPYPDAVINEVTGLIQYVSSGVPDRGRGSELMTPTFESFDYTMNDVSQPQPWSNLNFLDEMQLLPIDRLPVPERVDVTVKLNIVFKNDENGIRRGSFNGKPFKLTFGMPQLGKHILGMKMPNESFPVVIKYGDVVQVEVNNPELGPHPLHLHGHHFWVVGMGRSGDGPYNPTRHRLQLTGYRRDTVMVKERSWLIIRFKADNIGVWTLHCHVDWHNLSGMAMTFVEAPELANTLQIPLEARRVCADHNVVL